MDKVVEEHAGPVTGSPRTAEAQGAALGILGVQ